MLIKNILTVFCTLFLASYVHAEEFKPLPNKKIDWSFNGITGSFDRESIQRGYKVYKEVCIIKITHPNNYTFQKTKPLTITDPLQNINSLIYIKNSSDKIKKNFFLNIII